MSISRAVREMSNSKANVSFMRAYVFTGTVNLIPWILAGLLIDRWLVVPGVLFAALIIIGTIRAQRLYQMQVARKLEGAKALRFRKTKTSPIMKSVKGFPTVEKKRSVKK
ncbi:MAG: hypothetical protein E3J72_08940 [Planctomycetota bacterium]|nr:MAG: hypothetical protein E3J72_08940 [Planctomycetota bacterium]